MKLTFSLVLLVALSGVFFAPVFVQAAAETTDLPIQFQLGQPGSGSEGIPDTGKELVERIQLIANWVFAFFLAISLIYIVLGAFQFVTAGGDPTKITEARQKLIFAVIGIAIGLLTLGIPAIIRNIVV